MEHTIQGLMGDPRFYELLLDFDRQMAEAAHAQRCQKCGAARHWGSYDRKPRGGPADLGPEHRRRFSLCCAADGCRTRATPCAKNSRRPTPGCAPTRPPKPHRKSSRPLAARSTLSTSTRREWQFRQSPARPQPSWVPVRAFRPGCLGNQKGLQDSQETQGLDLERGLPRPWSQMGGTEEPSRQIHYPIIAILPCRRGARRRVHALSKIRKP